MPTLKEKMTDSTYKDNIRVISWTTGLRSKDEFYVGVFRFYWIWLTHFRNTKKWKNKPVIIVKVKKLPI